jgi:hypothetical protein
MPQSLYPQVIAPCKSWVRGWLGPMAGLDDTFFAIPGHELYRLGRQAHSHLRFEVFTAVTMKNGVFWDVTPCESCKNLRFGGN